MELSPGERAQHRGTISTYRAAAEHVAADVGVPSAAREIQVVDRMPQAGTRAIADGRTGGILIAKWEADALEALLTGTGPRDDADLARRLFTALHEGSHLTGPVIPDANPHMKVDLMWEEGLASLNARRLLPDFARQHAAIDVPRPALGSITYSGYAERLAELFEAGGATRDTAVFDELVRDAAERIPWRERPGWLARHVLEARSGAAVSAQQVAHLEPFVHGYVQRFAKGTGHLERAVAEALARIVA